MQIRIPKDDTDKIMGLLMAVSKEFPEHTQDVLQLTRSAKHGITVEILPLTFSRTRPQEGYYRKWCRGFATSVGMSPDAMHEEMLCITFGSEQVSTLWGWRREPSLRSGDVTSEQYSMLIEVLIQTAAEFGFVIPPAMREAEKENSDEKG